MLIGDLLLTFDRMSYPGAPMPSSDTPREPVPVTGDAQRSVPDARRHVTGGTKGK